MTFQVILCDPPWRYDFARSASREIENQYPTMKVEDICRIDVPAADDSVLYLWATSPKLREALLVLESWGFEYVTSGIWVKDRIGMGYYFRQQHELLLVGRRGNLPVPHAADRVSSVFNAPRGQHSAKPAIVHEALERMYPDARKLEMFARRPMPGWDRMGNEADCEAGGQLHLPWC